MAPLSPPPPPHLPLAPPIAAAPDQGVLLVTFQGFACHRCRHQWKPRVAQPPKVCPKCKSLYWHRARVVREPRQPVRALTKKEKRLAKLQKPPAVLDPARYWRTGGRQTGVRQARVENIK